MYNIRCKQVIDNFKDDIQIEYEVNKINNTKTFRVSSLNAIGQRVVYEEFTSDIGNHRNINNNYIKALKLYNKLISQYYGKLYNSSQKSSKK